MASITFLPLDLSGKARTNLREAEPHILIQVANKPNRACVLNHGAFYTKGMLVRDNTGRALVHGVDFTTTYNYNELSNLTAKEVMGLIVITNTAVRSPIAVTYQAVGGPFSISAKEVKELLFLLNNDDVKIKWEDIIGKPTEFIPSDHEHDWWQIYGMESTVTEIDRIAAAWDKTTVAIVNENNSFGDKCVDKAREAVALFEFNVRAHLAYTLNTHHLNKDQIGLSNVNNWVMADGALVLNRNADQEYFPIGGVYRILNTGPLPDLTNHIADRTNPHGTTADDADCWTKPVIDNWFNGRYLWTDTATDSYLFAGRTSPALREDVIYNLNSDELVSGVFPLAQLGTNSGIINPGAPQDYALCADGVWRKWSDLLASYNASRNRLITLGSVTVSGATSAITLLRTYYTTAAYPPGTYAFATIYQQPTPDVIYDVVYIYQRIGNDWQQIF